MTSGERTLREQVHQTIVTERLVRAGDRVLVGVSGGPDSVALLHLFASLQDDLRARLIVMHVDHQMRPDSADDASFVEELAGRLGLEAVIVTRDVPTEAKARALSVEDGARRIRYELFLDVARQQRADRLALGHTADDQAETVMMRLLRGAGLTGLTAIPLTRPLGEVLVIRPLLGVWRHEILAYLADHGLSARQDATNDDPRFLRNRIRRQLLPLLEEDYNPHVKALLNQLAEQCRTDAAFLQDAAQRHWKRLAKRQGGALAIRLDGFLRQPQALQRQLMRRAIQQLQGNVNGFEFRHWIEIERLLTERPVGTVLDLPGGLRLTRERDRVLIRRPTVEAGSACATAGMTVY
jgi:tRNA(Ile)-lysidine synthase